MRDQAISIPARPGGEPRALSEAVLRSETRRVYAVISVVILAAFLVLARGPDSELDPRIKVASLVGIGLLLGIQVGSLGCVSWARRHGRNIPGWMTATTVVIESLVPSGMMLAHIVDGALPAYATLTSPVILAYGLLLTLTTLRLRPLLCILSGGVAAVSYAAVLAYVTYGLEARLPSPGLPYVAYVNAAVLIFISGFAAAWVAREIRQHFLAAQRESDMRRQVQQMQHDLSIAQSIQRALLPRRAPDVPGFDIAGWNRPADLTGGDYYDWQELPDGNWMVTLADVSGHGIGPALVTTACRAYVRASSARDGDLGRLTARINRLLADDLPAGRFVTMVNVLIERRSGRMALLSAGHGPIVMYVGASGVVSDILPHDLPLAVEADVPFGPAQSLEVSEGDVLALLTDGFVEWARVDASGRREEFGLARLRGALSRHAHLTAGAMIEAITADVAAFAQGTPQQDDLTIVVIRRATRAADRTSH